MALFSHRSRRTPPLRILSISIARLDLIFTRPHPHLDVEPLANLPPLHPQEHTWSGFAPHRPSRPALVEGAQKLTYFLASVEPLSPGRTLFRHHCPHAEMQGGLREIDIVWDVSEEMEESRSKEGWFSWFLGKKKGHQGGRRAVGHARARPSPREGAEREKREKEIR